MEISPAGSYFLPLITSLMTTGVEVEVLAAEATGAVDVSIVFQELEGFGAAGGRYENWLPAHRKKANSITYSSAKM